MTIYILWLRQLKRYFRSRARIIGSLGQPLLFLFALGFGFGPIYEKAGGGNYMQFLAPGIMTMGIIFSGIFSGIEIIWDRQFGFLKETLVAPVSRFEIMVGRTLGGATVATMQGLIVFAVTLIAGFRPTNGLAVLLAFVFAVMIAFLFTALGTAIAIRMTDMQAFPIIMNYLVMPIFFLSGSLFPLEGLPAGVAIFTHLNPLTYGVDGLRGALIGQTHFGMGFDFAILSLVTLFLLWVGSRLFSKIEV